MEVKSGRRRKRLSGLASFVKENKKVKTLIVGSGGVTFEAFLAAPVLSWFDSGGYRP